MQLKIEKNIPFPKNINKDLVTALLSLKNGESVFLSYDEFSKTSVHNCITSARIRIAAKGLFIRTAGEENGRRVWVFKQGAH